jgi:hypothetical protein
MSPVRSSPCSLPVIRRHNSPKPRFATDEDRNYFVARFPISSGIPPCSLRVTSFSTRTKS